MVTSGTGLECPPHAGLGSKAVLTELLLVWVEQQSSAVGPSGPVQSVCAAVRHFHTAAQSSEVSALMVSCSELVQCKTVEEVVPAGSHLSSPGLAAPVLVWPCLAMLIKKRGAVASEGGHCTSELVELVVFPVSGGALQSFFPLTGFLASQVQPPPASCWVWATRPFHLLCIAGLG